MSNPYEDVFKREEEPNRGNYFWVKEPQARNFSLDRWDQNALSGFLRFTLRTLQPLHVGSGKVTPRGQSLYQEFYQHHGQPVIPGSSLKGVVRHHLITLVGEKNAKEIFGSTKRASRVFFSDALPISKVTLQTGEIPQRWSPRIPPPPGYHAKYYAAEARPQDLQRDKEDRDKEDVEAVPVGARFRFTVTFRNLSEFELGALLVALGLDPDRRRGFKLGGGKGYGFGLVWADLDSEYSWFVEGAQDLLKPANERPRITDNRVKQWVQAFWSNLPEDTQKHLEKIEEVFSREYKRGRSPSAG